MLLPFLRHRAVASVACLLPATNAYSLAGTALGHTHHPRNNRVSSASMATNSGAAGGGAAGGGGTAGIVWFKYSDLRLEDHEPLASAHDDCSQVAHVFCLDDRWFGHTR